MYTNKIVNNIFFKNYDKTILERLEPEVKNKKKEPSYDRKFLSIEGDLAIKSEHTVYIAGIHEWQMRVFKKYFPLKSFIKPLIRSKKLSQKYSLTLPIIQYSRNKFQSNKLGFIKQLNRFTSNKIIKFSRKRMIRSNCILVTSRLLKQHRKIDFRLFTFRKTKVFNSKLLKNLNIPKLELKRFYPYYIRKKFDFLDQQDIVKRKLIKVITIDGKDPNLIGPNYRPRYRYVKPNKKKTRPTKYSKNNFKQKNKNTIHFIKDIGKHKHKPQQKNIYTKDISRKESSGRYSKHKTS